MLLSELTCSIFSRFSYQKIDYKLFSELERERRLNTVLFVRNECMLFYFLAGSGHLSLIEMSYELCYGLHDNITSFGRSNASVNMNKLFSLNINQVIRILIYRTRSFEFVN